MALLCQTSPILADTSYGGVLLGALCDQRAKGLFCDVTIVVEDIKFRAHRNVLAASSGYFRSALASPDVWTSGQVLELMDLRSEVFARILNFIYSSKVALTSVEDVRSLVAAGKRLGIPFLERLSVSETRTAQSVPQSQASLSNVTPLPPASHRGRRKTSEKNSRRGPRITNAFSINDIATGNDPFTPLDPRGDGQRPTSSVPASCPAPDSTPSTSESLHTLADHSYAVSFGEGGEAGAPLLAHGDTQTSTKTESPMQTTSAGQASKTCSPLKKRYKLWGTLDEQKPGTPASPAGVHNVPALTSPSPDSSSPNPKTPNTQLTSASDLPKTSENPPAVSGPPLAPLPLKPSKVVQHREPGSASTLLHRRRTRVPGVLFCRFCHRKFMHLKRLRNHEQVCTRGPVPSDEEEEKDAVARDPTFISSPTFTALPPPAADLPEMGWEVGTGAGLGAGLGFRVGRGPRRMYPCSVCKRAYATTSSLRRHENVHSWQRAYPCHYCNKVFALAEYRTKHEVWHTGERRYQCIFCLETFMTYYILKNHQKSYHGIDPRLSVNRKSANGGFKGSVYPIKLYRLLPMKFRKRRYRSYGRGLSEAPEFGGQAFPDPLGSCSSPSAAFGEGADEPLTFMATPKMAAPVQPSRAEAEACLRRGAISPPPSLFHRQGGSVDYTLPELRKQGTSPPTIHDMELGDGHLPPDSTSGSGNDPEDHLSNAVHPPVAGGRTAAGGRIATYIAKPACAGPSSDSRVPPLCQITVKIGNEAIVRRSIAGSNLIPRKKRHHSERQILHPRVEQRRASLREAELCDDGNCDDMDEPWRPYYSYKSKRRAKRLRSRDKRGGRRARIRRSTDIEPSLLGEAYSPEENSPSDAANAWIAAQNTTHSCEDCQSTFPSPSALQTHIADCHPKERVHTCRSCGKQRPHQEEVPQDGGEFTCSTCARDGPHLDNPAGSPAPDRRYRCSFCPQRFLYLATRRSHERKHLEKQGKSQGGHLIPKPTSLGAHQKRQPIKTEDEEVEVQQVEVTESKPLVREELKLSVCDDPTPCAPVTLKQEDHAEPNGGGCDQG
ncbi:zinc finger and BTB domain-containing protein 38-like [Conger conger]|uniref:zinc finger and BTB domain-containing protein 38-like n=1 Tax=Conger conger TaxID=82655 RepID=UPI002A59AAD0|nr:zinc finger and BTB domain-containing protein 38-like [Conger conger]XP_061099749.1 zinc finger and BTB domain-containing protein 38-like [Conger conger]